NADDANRFADFQSALARIAAVLAELLAETPPSLDDTKAGDLLTLLRTGRGIRRLGEKDLYRLLRWATMRLADVVDEWFRSDLLRAAIAARALQGTALGPRSAGSGLVLLLRA